MARWRQEAGGVKVLTDANNERRLLEDRLYSNAF